MAELGSILLRRGTTAERLEFVPLKGEIIYDTELKQVFVGDGETYGGRSVFNDSFIVTYDGSLKVGENVAVIVDEQGKSKSLRLPGGDADTRPDPVPGAIRYNTKDKTIEFSDGNEWFFLNKASIDKNIIELHVSLDGHDDRRYGEQQGRSWGTAFRTLNAAMREAEDIVNANPETEPFVNEEQPYRKVQVQVHVASGIYEEHLPIRVPTNTSIFGTGQRRTTIRPKAGVPSESPWAKIAFWRETEEYPEGLFGFHYLTDPADQFSTPKDNTDIDMFLCNDTNWFHTFGTDLHNSFCFVLDPEGQILTKSPYPHTGVSFAKSSYNTDPYAVGFHGGMFADGFAGNQDFNIDSVESSTAIITSGYWRKPNMPTAFYVDGERYQADSVEPDGTGEEDAAELLRLNKEFIAEETVQYVNDTYVFDYNEEKCRRDLNLILRNVGYDAVLGTNFLTYISATAYLRPNSAYVLEEQSPQTTGAINYAKGLANTSLSSHTPTQAANIQLFDTIINTINTKTAPAIVWPDTVYDDEKDAVKSLLLANTDFITQELLGWITYQVNNSIAPFSNSYTYDQNKCRRDTEFLINAVIFDLIYGGNYATQEVARSYWLGINSQIPGQQQQHAAAFEFLAGLIRKVLANNENIEWIDKFQLDIPQELLKDIAPVSSSTLDTAQALVTIVSEVVVNGTNYAPLVEYPNLDLLLANRPPLFKEPLQNSFSARSQLVSDTTTIINSTIAFINTAYAGFRYDESVCRRDVGLIIEAMRHDLIYGGDVETLKAAKSYFETGSTVIADQEAQTVDAINYAKELAKNVVKNSVPSKVYQDTITQVQDSSYQSSVDIDTRIDELFGLITNLLENYNEIKAAHDLIETNKEWIQDEVIAFISAEYPSLTYGTDLCRRDTGLIVSAISNDLFGSFVRSELAGRAYYRGVSSVGDTDVVLTQQLVETLAANEYAKSLIGQILNNDTNNVNYPSSPYQTATSQTTNSLVVSDAIKQKASDAYDIILNIIENGEAAGSNSLPKYKVNINDSTPVDNALADRNSVMITAGNKSFVATDWTMFGNLGYGVLARNNARCELVSIFTYYCGYTYKAESGSEIRSLNGSSSNGIYALGAEGRNPFEVPIRATTLNETVYVAVADSTVVGDNLLGDLQIVVRNAVDVNGDPAQFFNVMVAEVDHGAPVGVVRYEIGNFQGNTLNIRGSAQGLLADIPDGNNINIRLLQEYKVSTSSDIRDLLLGAALIYDGDDTGFRIINIEPDGSDFKIRTIPTINHISAVANGDSLTGSNTISINSINYTNEELTGKRIGYKGTIYIVTNYDGANTLTLDKALTDDILDLESFRLSPPPGIQGDIFTDFSVVKAGNHDMLDIGTGAYEDSNYPRELYGPPIRPAIQSQEVNEISPGRVFFTSNDQDGNFRVGDYFRVNQGDGSISFNAAIALSNLDGLGFSRGVTINEFSADSDMGDVSDEAVPTEQAVVNYVNKRLGQDETGLSVGATRLGAGTLMLDGSQPMEGNLDMNNNNIDNLGTLDATDITADTIVTNTIDVNTSATFASAQIEDLTDNRIVLAGASGEIEDDANFTFDGTTFQINSVPKFTVAVTSGNTQIAGTLDVDSQTTISSLNVEDLTNNRIVIAGTNGELEDDANFTWNGTTFAVTGSQTLSGTLDVNDQATLASLNVEDLTAGRVLVAGTNGEIEDNTNLTFNGTSLNVVGSISVSGSQTISSTLGVTGNVTVGGTFDVNSQASLASLNVEDLTANRIVYTGTSGELIDSANLTFDGSSLGLIGQLDLTGDIIPTTANAYSLGTVDFPFAELFLGPGSLYINGKKVISDELDEVTISTAANQNVRIIASGTGVIGLGSNTVVSASLSANDITVDNVVVNDNTVTINGNIIRGTGSSAAGTISLEPGRTGAVLGEVTIIGNLSITGELSTSDTTLSNQLIQGNLTVQGNTTLGSTTTDSFVLAASLASDILPLTTSSFTIGSEALRMSTIFSDFADTKDILVRDSGDIIVQSAGTDVLFKVDGVTGGITTEGNIDIKSAGILTIFDDAVTPSVSFSANGSTGDVTVANDLSIGNNLTVTNNLTVQGNLSVTGTVLSDLNIEDNTVILNSNFTGDPEVSGSDAGVEVERGTGTNVLIRWNETANKWQLTNDGTNYDDIAVVSDVSSSAGDSRVDSISFNTGSGVFTLTRGDASTATVDLDGRYVLDTGDTITGALTIEGDTTIGDGTANSRVLIRKADNDVSDHLQFYNGTTRIGEIGAQDDTWLRINQVTAKNIYTPRYIRADGGLHVDSTSFGINSSGILLDASLSGTYTNAVTLNNADSVITRANDINIEEKNDNVNYQVTFSTANGSGYQRQYIDTDNSHFLYNPSTHTVTAGTFSGALAGNATTATTADAIVDQANSATITASSTNTANNIVLRDASGNFSAGTITATLNGTASNITSQANSATITASSTNTANNIVRRDASGNFSAGTITATLSGTASNITSQANSATITASSTNTANNIVLRDASGNFSAGTITATFNGTANDIVNQANSATITASSANTANNIVRRDANGDFSARNITMTGITTGAAATAGTITGNWSLTTGSRLQSTYADLAEIYATDATYDPGTVVMFGGNAEVTIANQYATTKLAGVITSNPAFILNKEAEGQAIALKGRIPVKVEGKVNKGDFIVASNTPGVGIACDKYIGGAIIGKAIANKTTDGIELIEVKI